MDAGTLADLIKAGPMPENVLARLTAQVIYILMHKTLPNTFIDFNWLGISS